MDYPNLDNVHSQHAMPTLAASSGQQLQSLHNKKEFALAKIIGAMTGGSFMLIIVIVTANALMPEKATPSHLWGQFLGDTKTEEIIASENAQVRLEKAVSEARADAQAEATSKAQIEVAKIQAELERTRDAYNTLYNRTKIVLDAYTQLQQAYESTRLQAIRAGQAGGDLINIGTSFMCSLSRANGNDPDGWCEANERVRNGTEEDISQNHISIDDLRHEMLGDLPDPAPEAVQRNEQQYDQPKSKALN